MVGLGVEDGGGPRPQTPGLIGAHERRIGEAPLGVGLVSELGLPVRVTQGTRPREPVGHGAKTAVLLPSVTAVVLGVTRRAGPPIPGDARRGPPPRQLGRPGPEGAAPGVP